MPFAGERLTAEQVGVLRAWIDQGAEWPVEPKHPTDRRSVKLERENTNETCSAATAFVRFAKGPELRNPIDLSAGCTGSRNICRSSARQGRRMIVWFLAPRGEAGRVWLRYVVSLDKPDFRIVCSQTE